MKNMKSFVASVCALAGLCGWGVEPEQGARADRIPAALVVTNHAGDEFKNSLPSLYSLLTATLNGGRFAITNPNDLFSSGLPESSALRIADSCDVPVLLTASIDDFSQQDFGELASQLAVTLTLAAKDAEKGTTLHACTVTADSPKVTPENLKRNRKRISNDLIRGLLRRASEEFLAGVRDVKLPKPVGLVEVAFACNVPGAVIRLDGLARGTPPLVVKAKPGVHLVEVVYPHNISFKEEIRIQDKAAFDVVLKENEEGRKLRQEDVLFANTMERMMKSGETDDACRTIVAKGYGKYLENSFHHIEGMPQVFSPVKIEGVDRVLPVVNQK